MSRARDCFGLECPSASHIKTSKDHELIDCSGGPPPLIHILISPSPRHRHSPTLPLHFPLSSYSRSHFFNPTGRLD